MPPGLFLIDANGPFFRGYGKKRINWSKIPFTHLGLEGEVADEQWERIGEELVRFCREAKGMGYTAVTLDDVAHLGSYAGYEPEVAEVIGRLRGRFRPLLAAVRGEGLEVYLTTDVLPETEGLRRRFGERREAWDGYYRELVRGVLDDFPEISGMVMRIGESDGVDVKDPIRTRLHVRTAGELRRLLEGLLPEFERRRRVLILRTWTVGAYRVGDLIWHPGTMERVLGGVDSESLVVSMKHGESDFFRYLPVNRAFFRVRQRKILELQARREYEGAGEFPSYAGWEWERMRAELEGVEGLWGVSVWAQTGGWHRFRRLALLEEEGEDLWIRLNLGVAVAIFRDGKLVGEWLREEFGDEKGSWAEVLLGDAEVVVRDLHYIPEFARQEWFFRRVRVPPILHVYWDSLFIHPVVRKLMRHFVRDAGEALRVGEEAYERFPRMIELARRLGWPVRDLEHWRDFCHLLRLARRYYFLPWDPELAVRIEAAKRSYKERWPASERMRFRIKLNFEPFPVRRRTLGWAARLLLRPRRGYRWVDRLLVLGVLGWLFRWIKPRDPKRVPKFLRKSAMGVESLFR